MPPASPHTLTLDRAASETDAQAAREGLRELVRAMARQQARLDHEAAEAEQMAKAAGKSR